MRDFSQIVSPAIAIAAATYSADTTPVSIDMAGFDSALYLIHVGAGGIVFSGTNKIEFVMEHSDDNSTWAAVAQADVVGPTGVTGGIVRSLVAAHAAASVVEVSYVGNRRYSRLTADFSGTHGTGTPIAAVCLRGSPLTAPVA